MTDYTVAELIEFLSNIEDKNLPVRLWNDEARVDMPITTLTFQEHSNYDGANCIILE